MKAADANRHWDAARRSLDRLDAATAKPWTGWAAGVIALAMGLLLVCLAALMVSVNVAQLRGSFGWVRHTDDVLLQISRLRESLLQAEASGRAFVLGGGSSALELRRQARAEAVGRLAALKRLVADNPSQIARLQALDQDLAARLARLSKAPSVGAVQTKDPAAIDRIGAHVQETERQMTAIRTGLDGVRRAELALLASRQTDADARTRRSVAAAALTALLALLSGIAGVHLLFRERSRHRIREMRTELMHTQRLALMGQTASALAHELNQPLTAASNYLAAVRRLAMGAGPELAPRIDGPAARAHAQLLRAGGIVQRLRSFIEKRETERGLESPGTLLDDAKMLLGTFDDRVNLLTQIDDGMPPVLVDRIQIQQVLVNLLRNAIEAMREMPRRQLVLRATIKSPLEIEFSVQDNGPGLPKEIASRLFSPFVTSKKDGMGVGLSICRDIVVEHGGTIMAEPAPGGGTVFRFTLPSVDESAVDEAA